MIKLNHRGIGLPTALGIAAFVIALAASLLSYAVFQSNLIEKTIDRTEAYANAVQSVDATLKIIVRDQNLDPTYLTNLETYMGVTIEAYSASVYSVTAMVTATRSVTSYITGAATSTSTYDVLFGNTGQEPEFVLDPLATPANLLSSYFPMFIEDNFPSITPQTEFTSITNLTDYVKSLANAGQGYTKVTPTYLLNNLNFVGSYWYVSGGVTIPAGKTLSVPEGGILVVDGNLAISYGGTLVGNVIVDGTFKINAKNKFKQYFYGTVYAKSNVTIGNDTYLGTISRPSFVITEGDTTIGSRVTGYGYFLSRKFTSSQSTSYITGGVYTTGVLSIRNPLIANPYLDTNQFYNYAIPSTIEVPSGGSGTTNFKYTFPILN